MIIVNTSERTRTPARVQPFPDGPGRSPYGAGVETLRLRMSSSIESRRSSRIASWSSAVTRARQRDGGT